MSLRLSLLTVMVVACCICAPANAQGSPDAVYSNLETFQDAVVPPGRRHAADPQYDHAHGRRRPQSRAARRPIRSTAFASLSPT